MDITSDLERFPIESSNRPTFSGTVKYLANGLLDFQCGINMLCQQFELKRDDNHSENFSQ